MNKNEDRWESTKKMVRIKHEDADIKELLMDVKSASQLEYLLRNNPNLVAHAKKQIIEIEQEEKKQKKNEKTNLENQLASFEHNLTALQENYITVWRRQFDIIKKINKLETDSDKSSDALENIIEKLMEDKIEHFFKKTLKTIRQSLDSSDKNKVSNDGEVIHLTEEEMEFIKDLLNEEPVSLDDEFLKDIDFDSDVVLIDIDLDKHYDE